MSTNPKPNLPRFAQGTTVRAEASRADIERLLTQAGATQFAYGHTEHHARILCQLNGRRLRFEIPVPQPDEERFTHNGRTKRTPIAARNAYEGEQRRIMRALLLIIKAQLEAWSSDIKTFDEVFLNEIVLPNSYTVGEVLVPQVEVAYTKGTMPSLLPGVSSRELPALPPARDAGEDHADG